jgi:hypothetical protein
LGRQLREVDELQSKLQNVEKSEKMLARPESIRSGPRFGWAKCGEKIAAALPVSDFPR